MNPMNIWWIYLCASVWSKIFLFSHYYRNHSQAKKKQFFCSFHHIFNYNHLSTLWLCLACVLYWESSSSMMMMMMMIIIMQFDTFSLHFYQLNREILMSIIFIYFIIIITIIIIWLFPVKHDDEFQSFYFSIFFIVVVVFHGIEIPLWEENLYERI